MHTVLTRGARLTLLALTALAAEARCQSAAAPELTAVNAVMDWRLNWIGDNTPFNACTVYEAARRPANFPAGVLPGLIRGLDRTSAPCEGRAQAAGALQQEVAIDSVTLRGDLATVFVTVRKGEIRYHEVYSLVHPSPQRWSVQEVRSWGALREYPVRSATGRSGGPSR